MYLDGLTGDLDSDLETDRSIDLLHIHSSLESPNRDCSEAKQLYFELQIPSIPSWTSASTAAPARAS